MSECTPLGQALYLVQSSLSHQGTQHIEEEGQVIARQHQLGCISSGLKSDTSRRHVGMQVVPHQPPQLLLHLASQLVLDPQPPCSPPHKSR